jgi:porin
VKIKPAKWYYAQAGLVLAIPNANNTANHGLDFQGARPADQNGLYFIAETGVTPQIGRSQLPGSMSWEVTIAGSRIPRFSASPLTASFGFYWQADQML